MKTITITMVKFAFFYRSGQYNSLDDFSDSETSESSSDESLEHFSDMENLDPNIEEQPENLISEMSAEEEPFLEEPQSQMSIEEPQSQMSVDDFGSPSVENLLGGPDEDKIPLSLPEEKNTPLILQQLPTDVLPSNGDILGYYKFKKHPGISQDTTYKIIAEEVIAIWKKANIPTMDFLTVKKDIIKKSYGGKRFSEQRPKGISLDFTM